MKWLWLLLIIVSSFSWGNIISATTTESLAEPSFSYVGMYRSVASGMGATPDEACQATASNHQKRYPPRDGASTVLYFTKSVAQSWAGYDSGYCNGFVVNTSADGSSSTQYFNSHDDYEYRMALNTLSCPSGFYLYLNLQHPLCKQMNYTCPSSRYLSDSSGSPDGAGRYCTTICMAPFNKEGSECSAYCDPGKTLVNGECVGADNIKPSFQLTCEQQSPSIPQFITDPVVIADGSLYSPESPDYTAVGHFPLQFNRTYHGHNSPYVPANVTNGVTVYKNYLTNAGWTRYVQPSGYTGAALNSIVLARPYAVSGGVATEVQKVPGYGYQLWRHNFSYTLDITNTSRVLLVPPLRDDKVVFVGSGTVLNANNLSGETLTKNTDATSGAVTWVYRDRANFVRVFNAKGLLITEQDVSGLSHHLTYDVANRLSSVTDDFGHTLSFSYDDYGRISIMTTPVGSVTYGYDDKGNLTTVTKVAGAETTTRTYVYDDSRFSYALTGIIDEKGVRYTSWTYDDMGRVTDNHGVNSAEKTTLAYADITTTVTNPLGKADIYTYATTGGARRLVSVAGQASTSCLAANSNYSYYDNGLLKSKTDWQGHVTAYEYNGRGLVTKVTEAQGTTNARVTTTDWHATFALPLKVTQGNQVVTYSYDSAGRLTGQQVSGQ